MRNDEERPAYLEGRPRSRLGGNTDHTDILWLGEDGELDPEEVIRESDYERNPALMLLLSALIKGSTPGVSIEGHAQRLRRAMSAITGDSEGGRSAVDDHVALLEVASAYVKAWYYAPSDERQSLKLRPIVRSVVKARQPGAGRESAVQARLERKFKDNRDLYLSLATLDRDGTSFGELNEVSAAFQGLAEIGLPIDMEVIRSRRLVRD